MGHRPKWGSYGKNRIFGPKIWPKIGIFGQFGPGHAGLFGALLVGRLVVVARGLYLARHLFTLYKSDVEFIKVMRNFRLVQSQETRST